MTPTETENNAYAKFWDDRVLWYVMVFSGVVNFAWALFSNSLGMAVPYYRKLTLHEIKVLEIDAT